MRIPLSITIRQRLFMKFDIIGVEFAVHSQQDSKIVLDITICFGNETLNMSEIQSARSRECEKVTIVWRKHLFFRNGRFLNLERKMRKINSFKIFWHN